MKVLSYVILNEPWGVAIGEVKNPEQRMVEKNEKIF